MSVAQVVKHDARLTSEATELIIMQNHTHADYDDGVFRTRLRPHRKQPMYGEGTFNVDSTTSTLKPKPPIALILDSHKKLGHMEHMSMMRLVKKRMAYDLPLKFVPKFTCDECALGKIIHFAIITTDATRYKWVLPLRTKNEVITKIKEWIPYVQRGANRKLICIRCDHGVEFTSNALESYLKEKGIEHQFLITFHHCEMASLYT